MNKEAKEEGSERGKVSEAENVGYSWDISLCVLASLPVVTVPLSDVNVVCEVVFCDSDCEFVELQTSSLSGKREASVALGCETEMNLEGPSVKAVLESVRRRPTPQSSQYRAVPEGMRSRAPPPPEGTPLSQTATWPGPPADPPADVNEMDVEDQQRRQDGIDANPPWNAREVEPAIRRRATRPAQWFSCADPSQERPRRRQQRKLTTHGYSECLMLFMPGRRETEKKIWLM